MVDISVIIVSWNAKELLFECLQSIERPSSRYKVETIVVDNASTDGAAEMVEQHFPDVKLIRNEKNLGYAKANNIGIKMSKGRYVCLVNSDAVARDGCLEKICRYMDENTDVGIVGPKVLNPDHTLQLTCREFPTTWNNFCRAFALDRLFPKSKAFGGYFMTSWSHDQIIEVDYVSGCFMMARSDAVAEVGLLDDEFFFYAEDKDWCKRFWDKNLKVVYFPEAEAIHYMYGSSAKDPVRFYIQEIRANKQYYLKHHSKFALLGYLALSMVHQVIRIAGSVVFIFIKPSKRQVAFENIKRSIACLKWIFNPSGFQEERRD